MPGTNYGRSRTQRAVDTPFDNTSNGFVSTEVQSAIEEINGNPLNPQVYTYSWRRVLAGAKVRVPEEQQMLVYQDMEIEDTGELIIEGEVVIIE